MHNAVRDGPPLLSVWAGQCGARHTRRAHVQDLPHLAGGGGGRDVRLEAATAVGTVLRDA